MTKILQHSSIGIDLASSGTNQAGWVMVFPAGRSEGYDGRGPYLLDDMLGVIAASLRERVDLPIDREHAIDVLPEGTERPVAGWIKELAARADGIYARVEWTARAKQQIDAKEYRYLSPCFLTDRDTGRVTRILRASLVSVPNLEVKAVAAAKTQPSDEENILMDETLKAIAAMLGMDETAEPAAILEAVKALKGDNDVVKEAVDAPAEATGEEIVEKIEAKIETETAAAKAKLSKELASANPDPKKFAPISVVNDLADRLAKVETASAKTKAQDAVDLAVEAGKVTPAMKDWALNLASTDMKAFEQFVDKAPVIVKAGAEKKIHVPDNGDALDDDQKELCKSLRISPEAFSKTAKGITA
jgi:phage I-like protein